MHIREYLSTFCLLAGLATCATGAAFAQSFAAPSIAWTGPADYSVSYQPCWRCAGDGLEEYQDQAGSWVYIGSGTRSFSNRAPGTYRYRAVYAYRSSTGAYQYAYSPEASAIVAGGSLPAVSVTPPLPEQLDAEYQILSGDIDSDGRRDLLVRRLRSGAHWGAEGIDDVLLRQTSYGSLSASVPNSSELAIASSWAPAGIELRPRDVNIDGYADLVIRGIERASGFSGMPNQILFAPGASAAGQPVLRAADAGLAAFSRDINRHLIDPEYYPTNVPETHTLIIYYSWYCGWPTYYAPLDAYYFWNCFYEPYYFHIAYQDFSNFDSDAMIIASADYEVIHGYRSADAGMERIAATIETVLDVDLGDGATDVLLGGTPGNADAAERRGIALFSALAGISEAVAQQADDSADPVPTERVQVKGRRVLGQGPFHTLVEFRSSTISGYDSEPNPLIDGLLVSEVDWPRDDPSLTLRLGYVDGPGGPAVYWQSLLTADSRYDDDLRYDLFPSLGAGGYNSNSYSTGLIQATAGVPTIQMASFVGGERPVPGSEFF